MSNPHTPNLSQQTRQARLLLRLILILSIQSRCACYGAREAEAMIERRSMMAPSSQNKISWGDSDGDNSSSP
jgi:hypothetical protein